MKNNMQLEIFTYGDFDFKKLIEEEKNVLCSSLIKNIMEIHKNKQSKRRKEK